MHKFIFILPVILLFSCHSQSQKTAKTTEQRFNAVQVPDTVEKIEKSKEEWKEELSDFEYYVIRDKGTERAFTGEFWNNKKQGIYLCAACGLPLFDSETKYKSGTGWPSFYQPLEDRLIREDEDFNLGYKRVEVLCARCGGHLGHVFEDGPEPTGLRYCINSVSLDFVEPKE